MKNTYFIANRIFSGESIAALYCEDTNQIFIEDGGDGTSSECEDWEVVVEYASKVFETELDSLDAVAAEIMHNGSELTEDDCYGSGAAAWIAAQEE